MVKVVKFAFFKPGDLRGLNAQFRGLFVTLYERQTVAKIQLLQHRIIH